MSFVNPAMDKVAFAGVGRSRYSRNLESTDTPGTTTLRACMEAIQDAGISPAEVDGVCGSMVNSQFIQEGLGLGEVTWYANPELVIGNQLIAAINAICSGAASIVLVYHTTHTLPFQSNKAGADPFRRRAAKLDGRSSYGGFYGTGYLESEPFGMSGPTPYAAWASRYFHEYGVGRDELANVVINAHTNGLLNPQAMKRMLITLAQYRNQKMVREPLGIYDMDIVVDGADAFILTTAARAADMRKKPVLIHAGTLGRAAKSTDIGTLNLETTGQTVVARRLKESSNIDVTSTDLLYLYDGFSIIVLFWLESMGFCGRGEAGPFLGEHWDSKKQRIMIHNRVPLNSHGGSLVEGATQGAGHVREAVRQLRGEADERQVAAADTALVMIGGILYNSQGFVLRAAR
jgi:acetyl-CoA acetyltransferase